jgi:hypothetical protein
MIFRILLWCVGIELAIACRLSSRLRGQLTRTMNITINAKDEVGRSYLFADRQVTSIRGLVPGPSFVLTFDSAAQGVRILLAGNAIELIVAGLARRVVEVQGDPTGVLWFYEMVFGFLPWRKTPRVDPPHAYVVPDPNGKVADRITREPVAESLDLNWTNAVRRREKLVMWEVGQGAPVPNKPVDFKHVVDSPYDPTENHA